jgi:hypothetical protein
MEGFSFLPVGAELSPWAKLYLVCLTTSQIKMLERPIGIPSKQLSFPL